MKQVLNRLDKIIELMSDLYIRIARVETQIQSSAEYCVRNITQTKNLPGPILAHQIEKKSWLADREETDNKREIK